MLERVDFLPVYTLENNIYDKLSRIAGRIFENNISIYFNGIASSNLKSKKIYTFKINYIGINGFLYVEECEINRVLNVKDNVFPFHYVEYLLSRHVGQYGVVLEQVINSDELDNFSRLVFSKIELNNQVLSVFFDISSLDIDFKYISHKKNDYPNSLKLNLEVKVFETFLNVDEIKELSDEDIIFL